MSKKKRTTKSSSKRRTPRHIADYVKKWGRSPDAADKRFYAREGRWPTKAEFAFYDKTGRLPRKGELAKLTREAKAEKKQARKIAARRGWETRKLKPADVRKWERDRRALQAAQKDELERAAKIGIKRPLRAHRWYDFFYISLSRMTETEIHALLLAMKNRGVKSFRIEREVPIGNRGTSWTVSPKGFASTKLQFMPRLSESDLLHGNAKTGLPSLKAMRSPGVDVMRYLVVDDEAVRDHFPTDIAKALFKRKRETRDTIRTRDEEAFYLAKGRKANAYQRQRMKEMRKAIDDELNEADEDMEDEDESET